MHQTLPREEDLPDPQCRYSGGVTGLTNIEGSGKSRRQSQCTDLFHLPKTNVLRLATGTARIRMDGIME